jgi:NAD(P)-dependent dehydrogenase (short-subunit alcohol dehydrogenase family)
MKLKDKVAFVTGAGSGIGRSAALALAREGARIGALSRTGSEVQSLAQEIIAAGGDAIALPADVRDEPAVRDAVEKIVARWGRLDIVFANAGINGVWAPIEEITVEEYHATMDINLKGTFLTIKHASPHLKKQGGSVIIDSSINGTVLFGNAGASVYSASKAAQVAMGRLLATELGRWNIRVNSICPGWIRTEINQNTHIRRCDTIRWRIKYEDGACVLPGARPGKADDIASIVVFLASDESRLITGQAIVADSGETLLQG